MFNTTDEPAVIIAFNCFGHVGRERGLAEYHGHLSYLDEVAKVIERSLGDTSELGGQPVGVIPYGSRTHEFISGTEASSCVAYLEQRITGWQRVQVEMVEDMFTMEAILEHYMNKVWRTSEGKLRLFITDEVRHERVRFLLDTWVQHLKEDVHADFPPNCLLTLPRFDIHPSSTAEKQAQHLEQDRREVVKEGGIAAHTARCKRAWLDGTY